MRQAQAAERLGPGALGPAQVGGVVGHAGGVGVLEVDADGEAVKADRGQEMAGCHGGAPGPSPACMPLPSPTKARAHLSTRPAAVPRMSAFAETTAGERPEPRLGGTSSSFGTAAHTLAAPGAGRKARGRTAARGAATSRPPPRA